jgi:hypothetical protein
VPDDQVGAVEGAVKIGPGVPANLKVLPPVVVNPYDETGGGSVLVNGGFAFRGHDLARPASGSIAAAPGDPCGDDPECNDCDLCTYDRCSAASCSGGPRDGFPCDEDDDCEGICVGGDHEGDPCFSFLECCSEIGSANEHGECVFFPCAEISGGANVCVNWAIPDRCTDDQGRPVGKVCTSAADCTESGTGLCLPGFQSDAECDDGLECNGVETCDAGECIPGSPLCSGATPRCREDTDACLAPCALDADCDYDESNCTNDLCDVDGSVTGTPGECYVGDPPCGPGGACTPGDPVECEPGRCCDASGTCSAATHADCTGDWLYTTDACTVLLTGQPNTCPAYGSGLAPQGAYITEVGPVTADTTCPGTTVTRLGDDYAIDPSAVDTSSGYVDVHILRMAASVQVAARFAVEFWDVSDPGTPLFIEDTYYPSGFNAGVSEAAIHTILFNPPLTIPVNGVVAGSVATNFGPYGAFSWVATDAVDVGTNSATTLFVGDQLVTGGVLGVCSGGDRDGQWCDTRNGSADCPPAGACNPIDDVLAFEMVVEAGVNPTGACCITDDGTCSEELPWECEAQGNVFQGPGTTCDVCDGNPFVSCNTSDDCYACDGGTRIDEKCGDAACPGGSCVGGSCVGGDNDGGACDCPGASCQPVGTCIAVPPACRLHACCEDATGECAIGFCDEDPTKPCNDYEDSTDCGAGETCVQVDPLGGFACPTGWTGSGYGTDCDPNCCQQPTFTGADTCMDATPLIVNIGAPGELVTVATTGDNSGATFDDFTEYVCNGGSNDGGTCDQDVDCPDGECVDDVCVGGTNDTLPCSPDSDCPDGQCVRRCGAGFMNPDGNTQDPGWWESFYIDQAAHVRIDLCCSTIPDPDTGVERILEPGWAQMYANCPCGGGVGNAGVPAPLGEGLGTAGYARGTPFCDKDNLWMTFRNVPKGTYYYPIYSGRQGTFGVVPGEGGGGEYQFHVSAMGLPLAACCSTLCVGGDRAGEPCSDGVLTCLNGVCSDAGVCVNGDLDGFACDPGTGEVTQCPGGTCGTTTGCDETNELICDAFGGFWLAGLNLPETDPPTEPIVSCAASPCATGACCLGPGECEDESISGDMTEADCTDGDYVGGVKCDPVWAPLQGGPCPVCPAASDPANCQAATSGWIWTMDRNYGGRAIADDFIAENPEISEFCFEPCFIRYSDTGQGLGECYNPDGDVPPPDDINMSIRFFEDVNGLPGAELPSSPGLVDIAAKRWQGGNSRCWEMAVFFDPPVSGFVVGQRYWIEFSAAGSPGPPAGTGCRVYLHGSLEGNGWSLMRDDHYGTLDWTTNDVHQWVEEGEPYDWGFCIAGGFGVPDPMVGACCPCDGACTDGVPWGDCMGYWYLYDDGTTEWMGDWPPRGWFAPLSACADITCEDLGTAGGGCPGDPSGIPGEDCINPLVVSDGETRVRNLCSTADEPFSYPTCGDSTDLSVTGDQWFEYHACGDDKRIDIDICDSSFVAALAVYTNGTDTCPLPEECASQGGTLEPYLISCVDDVCPTNGPTTSVYAETEGKCFLIRVMGQEGAESLGVATLEIGCGGCFASSPPEYDTLALPFDPISQKIRYLSFKGGDAGKSQAVRVTFHSLPAPYNTWNGVQLYVQQPSLYCENAGQSSGACSNQVGGLPSVDFLGATLGCERYMTDWTQYDVVHVFHEGIIPRGEYDVDIVEAGCIAAIPDWETNPEAWSPFVRWTQSKWADCVQDCTTTPCKPPDGSAAIADVTAILDKFKNLQGNVIKARADIEGSPAGDHRLPDQSINITDVTYCLGSFLGEQYPGPGFPPPSPPPVCP